MVCPPSNKPHVGYDCAFSPTCGRTLFMNWRPENSLALVAVIMPVSIIEFQCQRKMDPS